MNLHPFDLLFLTYGSQNQLYICDDEYLYNKKLVYYFKRCCHKHMFI